MASRGRFRLPEWALVAAAGLLLAVVMTWPIAPRLSRMGRVDTTDGMYAMWNVAWVARTLTSDPSEIFNANIFYPHTGTLAHSESNLLTGALGIPAWLVTKNVYATYNSVSLIGFMLSFVCMYALARRLTGSRLGAAVAGIGFAFCPYVYARFPHIQLQMTFGMPLSLLALHWLIDRPSWRRGLALGAALAAQGLTCAYYGILAGLMVGMGVLLYAAFDGRWRNRTYWLAVAIAVVTCLALIGPAFMPYLTIQDEGFRRTLEDARRYAFGWQSWLASPVRTHQWILPWLREHGWRGGVLFPGFVTSVLGVAGFALALACARGLPRDARRSAIYYSALGVIAVWLTLGPDAGLYTLLYYTVPAFQFLRAAERFGIAATLALSIGSAFAVAWLAARLGQARRPALAAAAGAVLLAAAIADSWIAPLNFRDALPVPSVYRALARAPRGAVAEFPFFYRSIDFNRHAWYMLYSTYHWQPLINGYSDHYPAEFLAMLDVVKDFPTDRRSFGHLRDHGAKYVVVHLNWYEHARMLQVQKRLAHYVAEGVLRFIDSDRRMNARRNPLDEYDVALYEIVRYPD